MKNSSTQIYLHIGLPKTATTSLQTCFFPRLCEHVNFMGVYQPRNIKQDSLYQKLVHLIESTDEDYGKKKFAVIDALQGRISENDIPILLSEEGFTVDSPNARWQTKIARLSDIFESFRVSLLVTVREPVSASHSLYVELYNQLNINYDTFEKYFEHSNQAKIFEYDYLHHIISAYFKQSPIKYIAFEKITSTATASDFFPELIKSNQNFDLNLANLNRKPESQYGKFAAPPTLAEVLGKKIKFASFKRLKRIKLINFTLTQLGKVTLGSKGSSIPKLDDITRTRMTRNLQKNNRDFFKISGINYEVN